jgi:hypothetical protein
LTKVRGIVGKAKVTAYVDDVVVAEGELSFMLGSTLKKDGAPEEGENEEGENEK